MQLSQHPRKTNANKELQKCSFSFPQNSNLAHTRGVTTSPSPFLDFSQCHLVSLALTGNKNSADFLPLLFNPVTVPPFGNFTAVCFLCSSGATFLTNTCPWAVYVLFRALIWGRDLYYFKAGFGPLSLKKSVLVLAYLGQICSCIYFLNAGRCGFVNRCSFPKSWANACFEQAFLPEVCFFPHSNWEKTKLLEWDEWWVQMSWIHTAHNKKTLKEKLRSMLRNTQSPASLSENRMAVTNRMFHILVAFPYKM